MSDLPAPSERFQRVRGLFELAVNTPPDALEEVLSAEASGDRSLIDEVRQLLAAHREASGFLSGAAIDLQTSGDPSYDDGVHALLHDRCALAPGTRVDVYEVRSMLGSGGMGEVYLGTDTRLDRPVALKLLPASAHGNIERIRRFEREARAASALNHPNIVTIYDIAETEHGCFIAMELVAGRTLREVIAERPAVDVVLPIGRQIAEALRVAHAAGIVHRDIKPENIMVRTDGYVKVLDFGLARLGPVAQQSYTDVTVGGITPRVFGTVRYMSPEQSRGEDVTSASDIFSFGLVLYELATARHPFAGESAITVLHALRTHAPAPPSQLNGDVSPPLSELIQEMLQKDVRLRPTAALVEARLAALSLARMRPDTPSSQLTQSRRRAVGRDREIAELRRAFEEASAGRGAMIAVSGEAGAGKTTLVEEFLADFRGDDDSCLIVRGRCSERLAGTEVYLPWLEALDHLLRDARRVGPARLISELAPTWFNQIAPASSVAAAEQARADLATGSKERLKLELTALLQELSRRQTVVLFFDDVHWADAPTVELLSFVADRFDVLRLLVITTHRPSDLMLANHPFAHRKHGLHARGVLRELALSFLSVQDIERYLAIQCPEHRFPAEVAARIHRRTGGSPLFMTDLVRYLKTQNIFAQERGRWVLAQPLDVLDRELPASVRGMIERKIGQLDESQRRLLTAASVQGYEFDSAVIAEVLALDAADVEEQLGTLERVHEFVTLVEEREFPDHTLTSRYRFTHVLYQNALYASFKPTRKAQVSAALARSLEAHWGDRRHEVANDLALLFEAAREFAPAADYCRAAAMSASELFASQEAEALARRGLAMIDKLPPGADRLRRELGMQLVMGNVLIATRGYAAAEVESAFRRAGELCRQLGDTPRLLPVHFGLSAFHLVKGQARIALGISHEFVDTAARHQDPAIIVGERHIGTAWFYLGEPLRSRAHLERASAGYDPSRHRSLTPLYGGEPEMDTRSYLGLTLWLLGYPDQAMAAHQHALRLAGEVSHAHSRAHTTAFVAVQHQLRRDWPRVRECIQQMLGLTTGQGLLMWHTYASTMRGGVMIAEGDIKEGIKVMQAGLDRLESFGVKLFQPYFHALIAETLLETGQAAEGLAVLDRARVIVDETEERFWDAELMRLRGELLAVRGPGHVDEAEAQLLAAIDYARGKQTRSFELRAVMSVSRLWHRQGRRDDARGLLAETYGWFTEGFGTADLQAAQRLLQQLS